MKRFAVAPLVAGALVPVALTLGCTAADAAQEPAKLQRIDEMVADYRSEFPGAEGVAVDQVMEWHDLGDVVFVDVRTAEERAISTLPGAISGDEFERDPSVYDGLRVVAYCTIGYRSARFAERMTAEGHEVLNFDGSLLAWTHAGGVLEGPDGPTTRLHVYGRTWNLAADGYETIW